MPFPSLSRWIPCVLACHSLSSCPPFHSVRAMRITQCHIHTTTTTTTHTTHTHTHNTHNTSTTQTHNTQHKHNTHNTQHNTTHHTTTQHNTTQHTPHSTQLAPHSTAPSARGCNLSDNAQCRLTRLQQQPGATVLNPQGVKR